MNEYEYQAKEFLEKTNSTLKIEYDGDVEGFPFDAKDHNKHRKYICILQRHHCPCADYNRQIYKFTFYGSYADWQNDKDPSEYDVLACLECLDPGTIDEFVAEYGYEVHEWADVHRIEDTYDAVKAEYEALVQMYSELELEVLAEIN